MRVTSDTTKKLLNSRAGRMLSLMTLKYTCTVTR
jgi:hypothetical protein